MDSPWTPHITGYITWLTAAGRTPRTINTRTYWINRIAHDYPTQSPEELTASQLATWLANPSWSPVTKKSALASVRGLYHLP